MDEIRRVLALQLQNQNQQEPHDATELSNVVPSSRMHDEHVGTGTMCSRRVAFPRTMTGESTAFPRTLTGDSAFPLTMTGESQKFTSRARVVPLEQRTISFAPHDTVDDIEDAAADVRSDDEEWGMGNDDTETRRIRQHAYLVAQGRAAMPSEGQEHDEEEDAEVSRGRGELDVYVVWSEVRGNVASIGNVGSTVGRFA